MSGILNTTGAVSGILGTTSAPAVGTGTDGYVFTATGAGVEPAWETAPASTNASELSSGTLAIARMAPDTIIQVVSTVYSSTVTITAGTYTTVGFSASITPEFASSHILVSWSVICGVTASDANFAAGFQLVRTAPATETIAQTGTQAMYFYDSGGSGNHQISGQFAGSVIDDYTTNDSTRTYNPRLGDFVNSTVNAQYGNSDSIIVLQEIKK